MAKPTEQPATKPPYMGDNPLLLLLEEKKEIMKAVRAGKPVSSVPPLWERIKKHD